MVGPLMVYQKFDEALLSAVDFAFRSLGESCQRTLYFHLKTTFHVEKADIPNKVEEFDAAMRLIFGDGAVFLERLILEKLCEGFEIKFEEKGNLDFVEAILRVRSMVLEREYLLTVPSLREGVIVIEKGKEGEKYEAEG